MFNEYELNQIERKVISEFTRNSKLPVHTDPLAFFLTFGDKAMSAAGCYNHATHMLGESIWYIPGNIPGRGIETFFHEMTHASAKHLNRKIPAFQESFRNGTMNLYAIEEIIAETTAMKLTTHFNFMSKEIIRISDDYIDYWTKRGALAPHDLHSVESKSQEAFDFILKNWLPEFNKERTAA
jgi:hypothetical protein